MQNSNCYYDNLSSTYHQVFKARKKYLDSIDQEILNFFNSITIDIILDVGIGDGIRANRYLTKYNFSQKNFYGLEPSKKMYLKALNNFEEKQNIINKDLESYQTQKKFDLILSLWNVIGHVSNLENFIKKASQLINHDGYFIFDYNNIYNLKEYGLKSFLSNFVLGFFKNKINFKIVNNSDYTLINYYKPSYILNVLSSNNFKIIKKIFINYKDGSIGNILSGQTLLICKHESK